MSTPIRAAAAAMVAALAAAAAVPALTGAQGSDARELTVREKVQAVTFVHTNPKASPRSDRLAPGDRVLTRQALSAENGGALGTLFTDCVNVGRRARVFTATLQCTSSYRFADGEVVAAGVVRLDAGAQAGFPITGGSGAYRGARGEITPGQPVEGYDSVDVLHLDG